MSVLSRRMPPGRPGGLEKNMPTFKTPNDKITAGIIERWRCTAAEEFYNIEAWRDVAPKLRQTRFWSRYKKHPGTQSTLRADFHNQTAWLVDIIDREHPRLEHKPLMLVLEWLSIWHEDRDADRLPSQSAMLTTLEQAMIIVKTAENAILARVTTSGASTAAGGATPDTTNGGDGLDDADFRPSAWYEQNTSVTAEALRKAIGKTPPEIRHHKGIGRINLYYLPDVKRKWPHRCIGIKTA